MDIQKYIEEKREIQSSILQFIENEYDIEENYQNLIELFQSESIQDEKCEIKAIFRLILHISNNHNRTPNFFNKIERILLFFKNDIEKNFTNSEIFSIFSSNKRIILFLIKEKLFTIDNSITKNMTNDEILYFLPESKPFIDESIIPSNFMTIPENFEKNREIGENDTYICELIRKDLIEEFIIYVNKENYPLKSVVDHSIYETNLFLTKKDPTLIEYSAFFGSVQVFKYLYMNKVEIPNSIWLYAIHGDNEELIHILEEQNVHPDDQTYDKCYKESIKCHHKGITNYIQENFVDEIKLKINIKTVYNLFQYVKNSSFIYLSPLYLAAKKNNLDIVDFLLKQPDIEIGSKCFSNCTKLKRARILTPIKTIKISAFYECISLSEVVLPDTVVVIEDSAFRGCLSLSEIKIPSSVSKIGSSAFRGCSSLKEIKMPHLITCINEYTFTGCSSLAKIELPQSLESIGIYAFNGCSALKEINFNSKLKEIGKFSFNECSSLTELNIPSSVTKIGSWAFDECKELKKVNLSNSIDKIKGRSFCGCISLVEINIPSSVTSIGQSAFSKCYSLKYIKIPESVTEIGAWAFEGCSSLMNFEIPPLVTVIEENTFKDCSSLVKISIPSNVNKIGIFAFGMCSSLTQITIPSSLKKIESFTFYGCMSLKEISIPSSVTKICDSAFLQCNSLIQMSIPSTTSCDNIGISDKVKIIRS